MLPGESVVESPKSTDVIMKIEEDVDLLSYVYAVFDGKWFILLVTLICASLGALYAGSLPESYQGVVRVDIVDVSDSGAVRPDQRLVPESIGMLEHGFVLRAKKDNHTQKMLAFLRSKQFMRRFMNTHNIYQHVYPQYWDTETSSWGKNFELDKGLAQRTFASDLIAIDHSVETDIVAIKIVNRDPVVAARLANLYVSDFNEYMREEALAKISNKLQYLREKVDEAGAQEIKQMLFRLMEAQTAQAMLANGKVEYAIEVLDPAVRPYSRYKPNRKLIVILSGTAGALLSTSLVLMLAIMGELRAALKNYAIETARKPVSERQWGLRTSLLKLYRMVFKRDQNSPAKDTL